MPHTTNPFVRRALVLLLAGALGCSSGDLMLPEPPGGGNVTLIKSDGDEQTGTVGEQLPAPLVVQLMTERNQPAVGSRVSFTTGSDPLAGTVTPDTATTNTEGKAAAHWTLGTTPGEHAIVVQVVGGALATQVAEFHAAAMPAAPDTLKPWSAQAQPGRRKREVGTPPVVRVVDRFGNPVQNVSVAWQVTTGGGQVAEPITVTGADGNASVRWTLGDQVGVHKLTAAVGKISGSPVLFTATVLF